MTSMDIAVLQLLTEVIVSSKKCGGRHPVKHEDDTNLTGNDAWMGKDFLEHFLFGWCFGEYGNAL